MPMPMPITYGIEHEVGDRDGVGQEEDAVDQKQACERSGQIRPDQALDRPRRGVAGKSRKCFFF